MPQPGHLLHDRYQLTQPLGQDASRQTWLAIDLQTEPAEPVVVKLLALSPQMSWDESKLFEREAQILQKLDHPRIPKYRDYFLLDSLPDSRFAWFALVQTYIPGNSLQQWIEQGQRFSISQIEKIAIEALSILVYLHGLDPPVLHRDIKPSNLIWGTDDRLYLVDFGAVQDQAVLEGATFTVVGTYGYVPLEQFGGRAVPASDLFALGATLIHLLTGTAPADLPQENSRIQFADRVNLDPGFVNWIGKLTEPLLDDRLRTAEGAIQALENRHALAPPITNPRPPGSRIHLKKSAWQLWIKIPPRGFRAIRSAYLSFMLRDTLTRTLQYWFWWYLSLPFTLAHQASHLLGAMFSHTELIFDPQAFEVRRKLFGIPVSRQTYRTEAIRTILEQGTKQRSAPAGIQLVLQQASVVTNPLSRVERLWLIQEIDEWLALNTERGGDRSLANKPTIDRPNGE